MYKQKKDFLQQLGDFGRETRTLLGTCDQFVCAAMVSIREIEIFDTKVIEVAKDMLQCQHPSYEQIENKYLIFKRMVVLLNLPHVHGEARLLDSDSKIRQNMFPKQNYVQKDSINFWKKMEEHFVNDFGCKEEGVLCIFTHYIPCTIHDHQCAELLRMFTAEHRQKIIISFDQVFCDTNRQVALNIMRTSKDIYVVPPEHTKQKSTHITGKRSRTIQADETNSKSCKSVIDCFYDSTDHWVFRKNAKCHKKRRMHASQFRICEF